MKKSMIPVYCALAGFLACPVSAEILTWRASTGQQYETKKTITEYVTMMDTVTSKPVLIVQDAVYQETAAQNKSTLSHIRGIPTFPHSSVDAGTEWTEEALITLNLAGFGFKEPLELSVPVSYVCTGIEELEGRTYYRIKAMWEPAHEPDRAAAKKTGIKRIRGLSTMDILWDTKSGSPKHIDLSEETQYRFNDGSSILHTRKIEDEFRTVTDIVRERIINQLEEQIIAQKVENVEVKQTDAGIVLSIENIQFQPDSSELVEAEQSKIGNIGKLLATLSDRKLSIVGHAANTPGSDEQELVDLSAARARSVADFLIASGFRTSDSIISSGLGGSVPLDTNDTPEGRSKNRRVEIIIMDAEEGL